MQAQTFDRDEFEIVKQLLASAARYAEIANKQSAENTKLIADNANAILRLEQQGKETDKKIALMSERIDEFAFQVNRWMADHEARLSRLDAMIDRYDGVLAYLMRKEQKREDQNNT